MKEDKMAKALVVYTTRTGETKSIAELIGEGIRFSGMEAKVVNVTEVKKETDLDGYDAYVFGAATYHGEMMQAMKTMLFLAEKAGLEGKIGGSFGAFGWSGEAPGRIYDTMKNIFKMDMVSGPLMLKSAALGGGTRMAQDYGREIAKKLVAL
jgi:flavorubredoxin